MDLTEIKHFEEQGVGKLKLSQAIRIGAKLRPQCFGHYFRGGASCALTAAYEAYTGRVPTAVSQSPADYLIKEHKVPSQLIGDVIAWNDDLHMSREKIADKVEARGC